jgi:hypothetical protein
MPTLLVWETLWAVQSQLLEKEQEAAAKDKAE